LVWLTLKLAEVGEILTDTVCPPPEEEPPPHASNEIRKMAGTR
jgi:hypothetical protein